MNWYGSKKAAIQTWIKNAMLELYFPQDPKWQAAVLENARAAFRGILRAERYLAAV